LKPGLLVAAVAVTALSAAQDDVDLEVINRIKSEALVRSRVMDHAFYLTDVHGPRLTGSPGFVGAAEWIEGRLREYGLTTIRREALDWERGWILERFNAELVRPQHAPLIGFPLPWSSSTNGEIRGEPILATSTEHLSEPVLEEYFKRYKGQLKGQIVLFSEPRALAPDTRSPMSRFTADELAALQQQWIPKTQQPASPALAGPSFHDLADRLVRFLNSEGVRLVIFQEWGKGGGVVEADRPFGANWLRQRRYELPPPMVVLSAEHYNRLARLVKRGIPTEVAINVSSRFVDPAPAFNLLAEIRGTDKADELVIIGAHLDSWTGATGATDNAAGVAVMIEAIRILRVLDIKPRRTIRLALWGGHEGEGLGSRTHVQTHYGTAAAPTPTHAKVSCYFNLDNGTGRIRGIYLQNNDALKPIFDRWSSRSTHSARRQFQSTASEGLITISSTMSASQDSSSFRILLSMGLERTTRTWTYTIGSKKRI
jgi:carboxypeptidase Q